MTASKKKATYEDYYKAKLETGLLYQDFVIEQAYFAAGLVIVQYASKAYQLAVGESRIVEIKNDEKFAISRRLWIETAEKATQRSGPYAPSGIYREGNWWLYAIGDYDIIFFFSRNMLQKLDKAQRNNKDRYTHLENNTHTSCGFLLPEKDAMDYADLILAPKASCKVVKVVGDLTKMARELHDVVKTDPKQRLFTFDEKQSDQEAF